MNFKIPSVKKWEVHYSKNENEASTRYVCFSFLIRNSGEIILHLNKYNEIAPVEYIKTIVHHINKLTKCVFDEEKLTITYEPFEQYNKNVFILNFIRYCWSKENNNFDNEAFFKALDINVEDPIENLTEANHLACLTFKSDYPPGHSNIVKNARKRNLTAFEKYNFNAESIDFIK